MLSHGGWIVQVTLRDGSMIDFRVYSDPRRADSDADGVDDIQEKADGTNPNSRDTDQDGLADGVDPRPTIQAGILYVLFGNTAPDPGEGTSWGTAFGELFDAMSESESRNGDGDATNDISEIWVGSGAYVLNSQVFPDAVSRSTGDSPNPISWAVKWPPASMCSTAARISRIGIISTRIQPAASCAWAMPSPKT